MTQTIEILISPSGQVRLETRGFSGSTCQAGSLDLEVALGIKQSEQLTSEFYAATNRAKSVQEGLPP